MEEKRVHTLLMIAGLIHKKRQAVLEAEEEQVLTEWLNESAANQALYASLLSNDFVESSLHELSEVEVRPAIERVCNTLKFTDPKPVALVHRVHFLRKWGWAAAVIIAAGVGIYFFNTSQKPQQQQQVTAKDIAPGKNGAILTLADGSTIVLDSMANGVIAQQGNAEIRLEDGSILYDVQKADNVSAAYNTMSTPKGRQYQLILPDGTKVWLNAASSLTYPTAFTGKERQVRVTGEAYFEVAKNKGKPFLVDVAGRSTVEVLGTHFNINAYNDEQVIKTTLLEGKVKVSGTSEQAPVVLKPGEQAVDAPHAPLAIDRSPNLKQVIAWKNGLFAFDEADLGTVMRQLARWYDVEVKYEGVIPKGLFSGEIDQSLTLSQVLKGLAKTRIDFRIEPGNKIIILPAKE